MICQNGNNTIYYLRTVYYLPYNCSTVYWISNCHGAVSVLFIDWLTFNFYSHDFQAKTLSSSPLKDFSFFFLLNSLIVIAARWFFLDHVTLTLGCVKVLDLAQLFTAKSWFCTNSIKLYSITEGSSIVCKERLLRSAPCFLHPVQI